MANSANYLHFQTLLKAYEKAYSDKDKNTAQVTVGKLWKK